MLWVVVSISLEMPVSGIQQRGGVVSLLNPKKSVQALLHLNVPCEQAEANVSLGSKVLKQQQSEK